MATSVRPSMPPEILRQQVTTLEAVITLALADPGKSVVHHLRTSTRRVEAQLALLQLLAKDSAIHPLEKPRKRLAQLRRAAGAVRDLDVARDLLKDPHALQGSVPVADLSPRLDRDCKALRKSLRHQRATAATDLVKLLERRGPALARSLERVLDSLSRATATRSPSVSPTRLSTSIEDWVRGQLPAGPDPNASPRELHRIRKVAKLARYMAESAPAAAPLAHAFQELQQDGGTWHDFSLLHHLALQELGKHSPLVGLLSRLTAASLVTYQAHLASAPVLGDGHRKAKAV